MKKTIGIIGGGNMGEALIRGLHKTHSVVVVDPSHSRVVLLKRRYKNIKITEAGALVPDKSAGVIILAVKPQDMETVLKRFSKPNNKLFISIAAGLTTKFFEKHLGKIRIVRAMPNLPALINEGVTGICAGQYATTADLNTAKKILNSIGKTIVVKESMIDAVTAVSGSGPAYVFLFVEQWINAAESLGFDKTQARELVYKTLLGSAHLLNKNECNASELRVKVTSKGGTTQAAMDVFFEKNFDKLMKDALGAAKKRAKELAK
jgi:pyrroline-5-carboxylate reductase